MENTLKIKCNYNKNISVSIETIGKLSNFLKLLLEEMSKSEKFLSNAHLKKELIQVSKDISISMFAEKEKNNEELLSDINKLKIDLEHYKKSLNEMNLLYEKTSNENKELLVKLQNYTNINEIVENNLFEHKNEMGKKNEIIEQLELKCNKLKTKCSKYELLLKNDSRNMNNIINSNEIFSESKNTDNLDIAIKNNTDNNNNLSYKSIFFNRKLGNSILNYLNLKDLTNFKMCNKEISKTLFSIKNDNIIEIYLNSFYSYISKSKLSLNHISFKDKEFKFKSLPEDMIQQIIKDDYDARLDQIKIPGLDLKKQILICLNFLERNVKIPLGKSSVLLNKNTNQTQQINNIIVHDKLRGSIIEEGNKESKFSFIKSFKNIFDSKILNNQLSLNSLPTEKQISSEKKQEKRFTLFDNDIKNDLLLEHLAKLNMEFSFTSPDEMKILLEQIYKEGFTKDFIKDFQVEIISLFSNLLFIAYQTLMEIKETDLIKEISKERYLTCLKSIEELEAELENLKSYNKTSKDIKEILSNQKNDLEIKYSSCKTEIIILQQNLDRMNSEKLFILGNYEKLKSDFESIKNKLIKEYLNIKKILERNMNEKKEMINNIIDFKNFFLKYNITEDGEILVTEADN